MKKVLLEVAIVALAGALLALGANALSPRGISLTRDYFREDDSAQAFAPPSQATNAPPYPHSSSTNSPSAEDQVVAHLKERGLQTVGGKEALELFHDVGFQQGSIIFIDVHTDKEYQEKHIPGAYQFDYNYHPETSLGAVLGACQSAQKIIIYCNGGHCTDSEMTALMLRDDAHIPAEKLFVYIGGITEWSSKGLPVETGPRNSGNISNAGQAR